MQDSTESSPFTLEGQPIPLTERLLCSHAARPVRAISLTWALLRRLRWHLRRATVLALKTALIGSLLTPGVAYAGPPTPAGNEFRVNSFTADGQSRPKVAVDADGDFVVTWQSYGQDGSGYGIYAQRYSAAGAAQGGEFRVNTFTIGAQRDPSVAVDTDGDFVIVWESYGQDGSGFGIYAQRYSAAGSPLFGEFQVNTFTPGAQDNPGVAMDAAGDFVIAWNSGSQDGSGAGIYAQRYNATGTTQSGEFRVNTFTTGNQTLPSVAMDADGDFVFTWRSNGQDGSGYGVYAQAYSAAGLPMGGEFRVNTFTTGNQAFPNVAMDADGDFVVAWNSDNQDGSSYGIYAQAYNATGALVGGEFRVNTFTTGTQRSPSLALDTDGDFIVTWRSDGQDGSSYGVYAQAYKPTGAAQGEEFRVNTFTSDSQAFPSVAMDAGGDFVMAWESTGQDGSGVGIYAQRFTFLPKDIYLPLIVK